MLLLWASSPFLRDSYASTNRLARLFRRTQSQGIHVISIALPLSSRTKQGVHSFPPSLLVCLGAFVFGCSMSPTALQRFSEYTSLRKRTEVKKKNERERGRARRRRRSGADGNWYKLNGETELAVVPCVRLLSSAVVAGRTASTGREGRSHLDSGERRAVNDTTERERERQTRKPKRTQPTRQDTQR